jgi:hypothetical protein
MTTEINPLAKMREQFPANQISKLPKETKAQIDKRKADSNFMVFNCKVCGGHHHKDAIHLDYVGHAALTDRMLDADIAWTWEPVAFGPDGLPALDRNGGLWIRLTVGGITRIGYGDADGKTGGNAVKEAIGDALRNAAMRFGAALDLWHKGDLHIEEEAEDKPMIDQTQRGIIIDLAKAAEVNIMTILKSYGANNIDALTDAQGEQIIKRLNTKIDQRNIDKATKEAQ